MARAAHSVRRQATKKAPERAVKKTNPAPANYQPGDETVPLSQRAMIVRFATHRWHAQKLSKKIAAEVAEAKGTEASRHKHVVMLLPDKAMEKINAAFSQAAKFHHANTSPWEDGGMRLLANRRYSFYMAGIAKLNRDIMREVSEFEKIYPGLVEKERQTNPLFEESDYPSARELGRLFSVQVIVDYLPNKDDFRVVGVGETDIARIRDEIEARTEAKLRGVVLDLWRRAHDCVHRISDRLKAYEERENRIAEAQAAANRRRGSHKGVIAPGSVDTRTGTFTDTLITNLKELVEVIPDLDLTDDPELADIRQRMINQLCLHEAEDLRQSPALRNRVVKQADAMLADIDKAIADIGEFI